MKFLLALALLAATSAAAEDWRPIDTAPRGGSRTLFHVPGSLDQPATGTVFGWWNVDCPCFETGVPLVPGGRRPINPTHWMEVPSAPQ
jgi:hypothetical protein